MSNIFQFRYGEDGLAGEHVEAQQLENIRLSDKNFERKFRFDYTSDRQLRRRLEEDVVKEIQANAEMHELIDEEYDQLWKDRTTAREIFPDGRNKIFLPCNMKRMLWNARKIFNLNKLTKSNITPDEIIQGVRDLTNKLIIVSGEDRLSVEAQNNATMLFNVHLRSTLCTKRVIEEHYLTSQAFQWVLGRVQFVSGSLIECIDYFIWNRLP